MRWHSVSFEDGAVSPPNGADAACLDKKCPASLKQAMVGLEDSLVCDVDCIKVYRMVQIFLKALRK